MAMDGLSLHASVLELGGLAHGKIVKIAQPERDALCLSIRSRGENFRLFISASALHGGLYLSQNVPSNPEEAPMFCMLLRKKIGGGMIEEIQQPDMDRVVHIKIRAHNELGDSVLYTLSAEIMGKHSNIILCGEDGVILDAIRRVGAGVSAVRTILPGLPYTDPPRQEKRDPRQADEADFLDVLSLPGRADKLLSAHFFGLSPRVADTMLACVCDTRDTQYMTAGEKQASATWLASFYAELREGRFTPCLLLDSLGDPVGVYPFVPPGAHVQGMPSMSAAMDAYAARHARRDSMREKSAALRQLLRRHTERCEKKLALYAEAIGAEEDMEKNRLYGELLTANLHMLTQNAPEAAVLNYYADPPQSILVPMDMRLSPALNAQRYYKKYQKAKAAREAALVRREQTLAELAYLEGQLDNLDKCTDEAELWEIREEMRAQGYIREEKRPSKARRLPESRPLHFVSSGGADIYVGKNNRQNDMLTLHFAGGEDIWLHTKDIPGSHVILQRAAPDADSLYEAAVLAAWYSKARGGENVAVDYTQRKNVKKPGGAKPGMVIYVKNKTLYVTPDEAVVKRLMQKA